MRFYLDQPLTSGQKLEVSGAPAHHALHVLRIRLGAEIIVFNGLGGEYPATVNACAKRSLQLVLGDWSPIERESPLQVILVQAVSSGDKMDYTIQKAVELGVSCIQPVLSQRSVAKLQAERAIKRRQHWQGVVVAACEQCGRNRLPQVEPVCSLAQFLANPSPSPIRWLLSPEDGQALSANPKPSAAIELLVGPEGGLSAEEQRLAQQQGFQVQSLGPRVLRTETAALAALAAIQAMWGQF